MRSLNNAINDTFDCLKHVLYLLLKCFSSSLNVLLLTFLVFVRIVLPCKEFLITYPSFSFLLFLSFFFFPSFSFLLFLIPYTLVLFLCPLLLSFFSFLCSCPFSLSFALVLFLFLFFPFRRFFFFSFLVLFFVRSFLLFFFLIPIVLLLSRYFQESI